MGKSRHFVVVTGASPKPLGIPGESLVIDSTAFLGLPALPRRITFCRAGYISLEFAHVARRAGAEQSVSNERVYAAGDVAGAPGALPLTPVAAHEGQVVASNLLGGNEARPDFRGTPSVVFTIPSLAGVGLTEKAAREKGINVRVQGNDSTDWYTNRRVHEPVGMYKIVIDADSDHVVGAHIIGASAEEVINIFAMAIRFGITTAELKKMLFAYPTAASDIGYMVTR